jgi:hypothetical protein
MSDMARLQQLTPESPRFSSFLQVLELQAICGAYNSFWWEWPNELGSRLNLIVKLKRSRPAKNAGTRTAIGNGKPTLRRMAKGGAALFRL